MLGLTIPALKAWLCRLPLRLLVMMNVLRLVGVAFLVSAAAPGGLPDTFAQSAGYGDIFAAVTALVLAVGFLPAVTPFRRRLLLAWNVLGMADLLVAEGTTISVLLSGGTAMAPLGTAPMVYVPYFFVPLLVFVHLVIFYRLATGMLASEGMPDQALRQTTRARSLSGLLAHRDRRAGDLGRCPARRRVRKAPTSNRCALSWIVRSSGDLAVQQRPIGA